tara:strand:+ start:7935 stop:8528 length:594 start_codon:yes stop_codon:yes gene_type:complete
MDFRYYKICIIGESNVGKSSIADRYFNNNYTLDTTSTIGAAYFSKQFKYNKSEIHLQLWDTAGQERYRTITPLYYRNCSAIILVLDTTNHASVTICKYWLNSIKQNISNIPIFIALNKSDLPSNLYENHIQEINSLHSIKKIKHVSAKNNTGIDELFNDIISTIYNDNNIPNTTTDDTIFLKPISKQKKWYSKCLTS